MVAAGVSNETIWRAKKPAGEIVLHQMPWPNRNAQTGNCGLNAEIEMLKFLLWLLLWGATA